MTTQIMQLLRDSNLAKNAMGDKQTLDAYHKDPNSKFADLHAKYNNLMVELGITVLPIVIKALEKLTPILRNAAEWIDRNRGLTKALATGFIILAGAMAFGGAVKLLSSAFSGLGLALQFMGVGGPSGITSIGTAMGTVSKGIGLVGKAIGAFSMVYAAWQAGQAIGGVINDNLSDGAKNSIGRAGAHVMALLGSKDARDALNADGGSGMGPRISSALQDKPGGYYDRQAKKAANASVMDSYVPPASTSPRLINNTIVMPDGRVLAKVVTQEQAKAASAPQSGIGRIDPSMTPISPGMNVR
jgi:hypothetical protein